MLRLRLLQLLVRVADRLPASVLYALASIGAIVAWYASSSLRGVTRDHMRHVYPARTPRRGIDAAARGAVRSAALYYVDFARYANLRPEDVKLDMPVEFEFRRIHQSGGRPNYYWKATPLPEA